MNFRITLLLSVLLGLCMPSARGQSWFRDTKKFVMLRAVGSTDTIAPFWQHSNQYGIVPYQGNVVQIGAGIHKSLPDTLKYFTRPYLTYGLEVIGTAGRVNRVQLPVAHLTLRWRNLEVYGGRKREIFGLADTTLSAGSYIWSGNALPMPKVQVATAGFAPIIYNGALAVNAGISHGWFNFDGVTGKHWLHQKWLYSRIGKPESRFQFFGGMNHQVMWGGYSELLKNVGGLYPPTVNGYLAPQPLYLYPFVVLPFLQKFIAMDASKVSGYDGGLAAGNQLGSVDIALRYQNPRFSVFLYHQKPYDFGRSISKLNNLEDGNNGLSIRFLKAKAVKGLTLEWFSTTSQGRYRFGKYMESNYGEHDSYFNHGQYRGWVYDYRILGTPFMQIKNISGAAMTHNRVQAASMALFGQPSPKFSYMFRANSVRLLGSYGAVANNHAVYLNAACTYLLRRDIQLAVSAGFDQTPQKNQLLGGSVSFIKNW